MQANRAAAVAMTDRPEAGLAILEALTLHPDLARWPHLHTARAGLLAELGRVDDAITAYREAPAFGPHWPSNGYRDELTGRRCRHQES